MIKRKLVLYFMLLFSFYIGGAQGVVYQPAIWKLLTLQGEISLNGQFNKSSSGEDYSNNLNYGGGVKINTDSYIWHPNFMLLSVSGDYSPQLSQQQSSQLPEYFFNINTKSFNVNSNFFRNLKYNFNTYYSYVESLSTNDIIATTKIDGNRWGGVFNYNDKYNIRVSILHNGQKQQDQQFNRDFSLATTTYNGSIKRSFFKNDRNELTYQLANTSSEQTNVFKNTDKRTSIYLTNSFSFDKGQKHQLSSTLFYNNSQGTVDNKDFGFNETIQIKLAKNTSLHNTIQFRKNERVLNKINELRLQGRLKHTVYKSLFTTLSVNYNRNTDKDNFDLKTFNIGFSSNYSKSIPKIKGKLNINYVNNRNTVSNTIENSMLTVFDERYLLEDGSIVILQMPNIILETIIVTDETNTLIYEENIDYILIQSGDLIEIQRIIGGAIPNNTSVFIDYSTFGNESFEYNLNANTYSVSLSFLNNLFDLSYLNSSREYKSTQDLSFLNLFDNKSRKYSARFKYKTINAEVTYQDEENIYNPIKLWSYNINIQGAINNKINYGLNGNLNDYKLFYIAGEQRKHMTLTSDLNYNLNYKTKINFSLSYFNEIGSQQNLKLFTGGGTIQTRFNQLYLSLGVNYYNRLIAITNLLNFRDNNADYVGVKLKIIRKF